MPAAARRKIAAFQRVRWARINPAQEGGVTRGRMRQCGSLIVFILASALALGQQPSAKISTDYAMVKAGENFEFTISLDKTPNFSGGDVGFTIAAPKPEVLAIQTSCGVKDPAPTRVFHCSIRIPETASGGTWTLGTLFFIEGGKRIDLNFEPLPFQVIPNPNLVFPTSAEITVNLSQAQLLRREAVRLEKRIQLLHSTLKEYIQETRKSGLTELLQGNIKEEIEALRTTEADYLKLANPQGQTPFAPIFFDDLRINYEHALLLVNGRLSATPKAGSFMLVDNKLTKEDQATTQTLLGLAVLRSFEQNELAYKTVVDVGSLVFNLEINSAPAGASISYYRRGESPRKNSSPTNSTIHSLPYAIWNIKLEMQGYQVEEREYDPFREPNRVVTVELRH
jgi:hypothetical protein